jgi:hypothetical protein
VYTDRQLETVLYCHLLKHFSAGFITFLYTVDVCLSVCLSKCFTSDTMYGILIIGVPDKMLADE